MRNPIIAANWKMFKTVDETLAYIDAFLPLVKTTSETEVVLAPPLYRTSCRGGCRGWKPGDAGRAEPALGG